MTFNDTKFYLGMGIKVDESQEKLFKEIKTKRGYYYVCENVNPSNNIYFRDFSSKSFGFGGAILQFNMEDGSTKDVQGPWHSNSDSLFAETGIDFRNMHYTQGILMKTRPLYNEQICKGEDILYFDETPKQGKYDRIETLAQEYANKLNIRVYYIKNSCGGGSQHYYDPELHN